IVDGPEKISYQLLQERANHLADILKQKGIGPGSIVAILLFRSPAMIVSMLAVLKAGGAYLPIETDLPVGRIKLLIDNSRCSILLAGDGTTGLAVAAGQGSGIGSLAVPEIINVDKLDVTHASGLIVQLPANPQDAAYVIYTSGTTGLPKGVVIEHRSLVNYIHWAAKSYLKKEKGDFPLYTSISFDLTVTSIFLPLVTGNSIIIYKEEAPGSLIELVVTDNRVDIIKATPSHLKILLQSKVAAFLPGSRINTIIVGGEKLETALALEIYNAFNGNVAIYNEYGPTEATVGCMIHLFSPLEMQRAVPIGVPAANTRIYVLDKYLQPVPAGVHGEIYIAGNGLARAYLFNESMTAEKFIPDPFRKGEKMYKTGDIAKWLPNGVIEYIGRSDLQVKINGYRIELSEIENALNGFPEISASLVTVRINPKNKQILSAFYISTGKLTESALRDYLADRLPYYMIPVHVTRIERIPLTRNGKIDYNALPEPEGKEKSNHELPVSEIEAICLNVWEEVLGLTDLHVDDNFFELGGDSIKAVQISFRLAEYGISISAKDILTYQVIRSISLHAKMTAKGNTYEQGLVQGERSLLPIEAWFITRNFDNPDYYNQSVLLTLNRPINREWLQLAFKNIVRHHDGLRLNYDPEKRKLWYNNNHLDDAFIIGELEEDLVTVCHRVKSSFDIRNGLLLKAALIKENSSLFGKLLITAHHLVMDGISWRILLEDLYAVYHAIERGAPVRLPSKTASSIEWEKRLVEYAGTPAVLAEQPYWSKIENSEFDIPTDFRTHDWRMINIGIVKGSLNKETTGFLLKGAHQAYNTDILILLNAALAGMLKEWTGMARFIIELENHGRYLDSVDTSRTIGWFTGMYPVELSCPEGNPGELIKAVKEQIRNTPAHGIGYGIWKYLAPGNRTKAQDVSITAIRFNYLGQFDRELNNDLFSYSTESSGSDADSRNKITAKLEFNLMIISEVLYVDIKYNTKAYKESTIEWIRETFLKKIHALLAHLQNETSLHFTPSDFEIDINQQELDALFK
ncbi:MAG: amino acid adenylation domain-containing protein, partial [Niastella sp.]|uniref:amino acid adenylation domain-containing protein n=1 Tax=Niastella sp. TaxID=1869183 RepID=UPI00389A569C